MRDALAVPPSDVQAVVVIRHAAISMAFNDTIWAKYELGKESKVKDYSTKKWATRNPFASSADRPQATLTWLATHGHFLLGCDLAMHGMAGTIAQNTKQISSTVYDELAANLVPGVIMQPTGVYAVHRAQEAGCTYIRSS